MFGEQRVSCIMPTHNRREFVPLALDYFLRQDYPNCELVVVDDGSDAVEDLMPADPRIRYQRLEGRHAQGVLRNLACEAATGEIIAHWDDDDWQASWRVSYQVACLLKAQADICGLQTVYFYEPATNRAWQYRYPADERPWVYSATFCFTKAFWERNPFPATRVATGTGFLWNNRPKTILPLEDSRFYVGTIHARNVSPKRPQPPRWQPCPLANIEALMGEDWLLYHSQEHGLKGL